MFFDYTFSAFVIGHATNIVIINECKFPVKTKNPISCNVRSDARLITELYVYLPFTCTS